MTPLEKDVTMALMYLRGLVSGLNNILFPNVCLLCQTFIPSQNPTPSLCLNCDNKIQENAPPFCLKCSRQLIITENEDHTLCPECQKHSYAFDSAWGICVYDETMRRLLHLFKYGQKTSLRHYFKDRILSFLHTYHIDLSDYDRIVPIPLHSVRLRERGYNQSELLAQTLAEQFHLTLCTNNFFRVKNTPYQARLTQKDRWTNIAGAFRIKQTFQFSNNKILLVDDLMTTGATVSEAARILKQAEAKRVDVLTLAIAGE